MILAILWAVAVISSLEPKRPLIRRRANSYDNELAHLTKVCITS